VEQRITITLPDMWVQTVLLLPVLTFLQTADANIWFKNLYKRSDVIHATPNAHHSTVLYDKDAFRALDSSCLQSALQSHHILVTDQSYVAPKFDKVALVNILKSESRPFLFIGMHFFFLSFGHEVTPSLDPSEPEKANHKNLKDLLDQVQSDDGTLKKSGRIYTILKTPTVDGPQPDSRIATDIQAFHATVDRPLCRNRTFPLVGNQWATLSTPHAVHQYEDGGLGTFIHLEIGHLFLFISKSDTKDQFSLRTNPFDQQTVEVVLLAPGSTMFVSHSRPLNAIPDPLFHQLFTARYRLLLRLVHCMRHKGWAFHE
jgi:hypothetical protein